LALAACVLHKPKLLLLDRDRVAAGHKDRGKQPLLG
jgi:hypothetical protein